MEQMEDTKMVTTIKVVPIKKESRPRDRKRNRLLLNVGRTVLRLPRREAVVLLERLDSALRNQRLKI